MIHFHRLAQMRIIDTPLMGARTVLKFFIALVTVHIRRRTSDITNDPFEIFILGKLGRFRQNRRFTSSTDRTPLMNPNSTKITLPPTPLMGHNRELDRLQTLHLSLWTMIGMKLTGEWQCRYCIHLILIEIVRRGILDRVPSIDLLTQSHCTNRVIMIVKCIKEINIFLFVLQTLFMRR